MVCGPDSTGDLSCIKELSTAITPDEINLSYKMKEKFATTKTLDKSGKH